MVKSLLATIAALSLSITSAQAIELESGDNSPFTQVCIAAVESNDSLQRVVTENGIKDFQLDNITCNDMPLNSFVKKFRSATGNDVIHVTSFENVNNSIESDLCIAAATSNAAFKEAQTVLNVRVRAEELSCNGQSLTRFAKKFNKAFNG
ncbi:hypothetical protein [Alteromonas sp. A079]|uniref:hypothetical protein n=1 Tax=Alteromonas sp. A079 TaxID=3410268 RepID=UPI003BA3204F